MTPDALALRLLASLLPALVLVGCDDKGDDSGPGDDGGSDTDLVEGLGCMAVDAGTETCPSSADIEATDLFGGCGSTVDSITGEGSVTIGDPVGGWDSTGTYCCYPILETPPECDYGRPYLEAEGPRVAPPVARSNGWVETLAPDVAALSAADRAVLAQRWTVAAQDEHAAVAAFHRVGLDLLCCGAPADLLEDTARAARDEVQHARLGFGLASAYAGRTIAPGPFPFGEAIRPNGDLVALAVAAAREGCVGETVATLQASQAAEGAVDPAARHVLRRIAADETRHAQLAWRTVAWALQAGGTPVRLAVAAVFADVAKRGVHVRARGDDGDPALLAAHGLLRDAEAYASASRAISQVILPMARRLLGEEGAVGGVDLVQSW
jgi:hypothetical protein